MFELKIALRRLFQKGDYTWARLLSLIAGLAFGVIIFSEVLFYYSCNRFYPDSDRTYEVATKYKMGNGEEEYKTHPRTSGAIALGLKLDVPGVTEATRLNPIGNLGLYDSEKRLYSAYVVLADEHLFDVLPRPMIKGDSKSILTKPMTCMVSSDFAEELGGDVIGKTLESKSHAGKKITIEGVFEAIPENSSYRYDIAVSMISIKQLTVWDGSENWIGNDRYYTCVKLEEGIDPKSLSTAIRQMQVKHQDIEKIERENNLSLYYELVGLEDTFVNKSKTMIIVLSAIGFLVLFVSLMNYVLLTLNALVHRLKSSAIYKTCGAESVHLHRIIFSETILLFSFAIVGACAIILAVKSYVEEYVDHQLSATMTQYVVVPIFIGIVIVALLASYLPGRYFSKTPIITVFRNNKVNRNKWKLSLLGLQFIGVAFIVSILMVVSMQYSVLTESNHGFNVEGVYYCSTFGMSPSKIEVVLDELESMPEIECVSLCEELPLSGASGNNIRLSEEGGELFNIADFYYIDQNYLSLLGMSCTNGANFDKAHTQHGDLLLSQKSSDLLKLHTKWNDVIGHDIIVTEYGSGTIRGIYPDFVINSFVEFDNRGSVFHFQSRDNFLETQKDNPEQGFKIAVKVREGMEKDIMNKLTKVYNLAYPNNDAYITSLEQKMENIYHPQLGFKSAMMAGNIVVIFIMLLGLFGYTSSEGARRAKELAVRRVNGAELSEILYLFLKEVVVLAIPTLLIGVIGAYLLAHRWMESFAKKVDLNSFHFIVCSTIILVMIIGISVINYSKISRANPVKYLRSDE